MNKKSISNIVRKICLPDGDEEINFQEENQYEVLGLLCMHRCAAIAYYNLWIDKKLVMLNREMRSTLQAIYENSIQKQIAMEKALIFLAEILAGVEFRYVLLKGAKLMELYPKGTRTSNDIDILIERESIPAITEVLFKSGFQQGYIQNNEFKKAERKDIVNALLNRGETTPFVKEVNWEGMQFLEIDVNISVNETCYQKADVVTQMLKKAKPDILAGGNELFTLDTVDFLIHLCIHLYKEATVYQWVERGRDLSLYKFLDIYVFWKQCIKEEHIQQIKYRAEKYNVCDDVYYSLYYTNKLWDLKDKGLEQLLSEISAGKEIALDIVYDPVRKTIFRYNDDFEDRIFNEQHKHNLMVVKK